MVVDEGGEAGGAERAALSVMIVTGLIWPVVGSVSGSTSTCQRVVRFGQGELDRGDRVVLVGGG